MAVIEKRPPWFDRFTRLIERSWAHHGPCGTLHFASAFDTESGEWLIVAAPVFQEVLGGEDDGKKVWTGFVFHAGTLLRALTDIRLTAASYCTQSNPTPQVTIQGRYRGHRVSLKVLMEPLASQPVVEIIDTIKFEIRKIAR